MPQIFSLKSEFPLNPKLNLKVHPSDTYKMKNLGAVLPTALLYVTLVLPTARSASALISLTRCVWHAQERQLLSKKARG